MRRSCSILTRSVTHAVTHPQHSAPGCPAAITAIPVRPSVATTQPAHSPFPLSSAPTPHYRQHHDVVAPQIDAAAFRQGWLVQTRLYSLFEAGKIEHDGLDAALAWRRWAEVISPTKVQSSEVRVDTPAGLGDGGMAYRIDTAGRLRQAAAALGPLRIAILEACALRDHAWQALARLLRVSDKTAKDRAVEAIAALAAWRAGEAVPPPPELRFRCQPSLPIAPGWSRVLRPAVTTRVPERVLHTPVVRELLLRRMVEVVDGAAWDADARQRNAQPHRHDAGSKPDLTMPARELPNVIRNDSVAPPENARNEAKGGQYVSTADRGGCNRVPLRLVSRPGSHRGKCRRLHATASSRDRVPRSRLQQEP